MKLKKSSDEQSELTPVTSAPIVPDRYKLDEVGNEDTGKTGAMIALICSLVTVVLLGVTAWLMFQNWDLIQNV